MADLWFGQDGVILRDFPAGHEKHDTGWSKTFDTPGTYTGGPDFPNDDTSYVEVTPGYSATLRQFKQGEDGYPGTEIVYEGGTKTNVPNSFDNRLSEIEVRKEQSGSDTDMVDTSMMDPATASMGGGSNMMLYIGIAAVVLIGGYMVYKKKKS